MFGIFEITTIYFLMFIHHFSINEKNIYILKNFQFSFVFCNKIYSFLFFLREVTEIYNLCFNELQHLEYSLASIKSLMQWELPRGKLTKVSLLLTVTKMARLGVRGHVILLAFNEWQKYGFAVH